MARRLLHLEQLSESLVGARRPLHLEQSSDSLMGADATQETNTQQSRIT